MGGIGCDDVSAITAKPCLRATGGKPNTVTSIGRLFFGHGVQAVVDKIGPVPGQHLRLVGLVVAFQHLDLLGPALQRRFAILGRDRIGVDKFLSKTGLRK
jgi:hypothetical protein